MAENGIPRVAVHKFSSCDGCQLALLSLEDELLAIAERVDLAYFLEARSARSAGPYDIALVEGSITTPHEAERIQQVRKDTKYLITIGACAMSGGIQSLRNWATLDGFTRAVYATPEYIHALPTSTPIAEHVAVDYELSGCPVNKQQLLEVITSLLHGRTPQISAHSVCLDCKRNGVTCVMVARDIPCLGPVTRTGCDALCPSWGRGCFGCYGPAENSRPDVLAGYLSARGLETPEILRMLRGFTGYAQPFRTASEKLERGAS